MKERIYLRTFRLMWPDPTAEGGYTMIPFDPTFDRVPSTGELVNTVRLARQYLKELEKPEP